MGVVVAEQNQVGLQATGVDLDLVDVRVTGLQLGQAGMGDQQVGGPGAAAGGRLVEGIQGGLDGQHLRHGVDHQAGQLEALVGQAVGEVDLGEAVRQGRVGAARARAAGGCRGCR